MGSHADMASCRRGSQAATYGNSGAEANEGALKLARKYGKQQRGGAYEVITATNSFHGHTLAALAATGQAQYRPLHATSHHYCGGN